MLAPLAQAPQGFPGGPDDLEQLLTAFYLLLGGGFVLAVLGRMLASRTVLTAGIVLVLLGTAVFLVAVGKYD